MYFASRLQAGRMLAAKLAPKYRYENCAVMALNDGGVMVGAQIASALHCVLTLMLSDEIDLPREPDPLAGITSSGTVTYNSRYSEGEIDELLGDYYNVVEQEKLAKMHEMNHLLGHGGTIDKRLLRGRNIIVVSDGLNSGFPVDLAAAFLKSIKIEKLVVAVPLASVRAVDRMHVLADDLYCLSVVDDYFDTSHYYEKQDIPNHKTTVKTIENIILKWK
jgi:putative phosphoribosyl transferase